MSNYLSYVLLIILTTSFFILAYLSFINNPRKKVNQVFSALVIAIAFWGLASFLEDEALGNVITPLLLKADFSLGFLVGYLFFSFSIFFPRVVFKLPKLLNYCIGLVTVALLILSFTSLVAKDIYFENGIHYSNGALFIPYSILLTLLFLSGGLILIFKFKKMVGIERLQTSYFFYGAILSAFLALLFNLVVPNISAIPPQTSRFGIYGISFLVGATTYSIVKHRLLDIEVIIRRSLIYSVLLAVLVGLYSLLVLGLNSIFLPGVTTGLPRITDLIAIIIVAFTIDPLKKFIEKSTDKIFFKARYDAEETISQLSETLVSVIDLPQLVGEIKKVLHDTLKVSKIAIYTKADSHYKPLEAANDFPRKLDLSVEKEYFLASYFTRQPEILVLDEVKRNLQEGKRLDPDLTEAANFLSENGVAVVAPLLVKGDLSGALFLGEKLSQDIYSGEDLRFLEILSRQAALALENAKLYEEEKLYGVRLKKEVARATTDLRHANVRLKELDLAKDEFVSIASHELRTPMTAIKSYAWLALHNRAGELNERLRDYLDKVYTSSERMIALISDMLNVSRIETGRIQMEIGVVSVYKIIDMVMGDLSAKAGELGVVLNFERDNITPLVLADRNKLAEVLTNLVGNSLKFTPKGGKVTIAAKKAGATVEISVNDTGVGISKENMPRLFAKFGRIESSYATAGQAAATGTGLGLWISKNYVEKMGGKIRVDSTLGKGTTFTFSLPVATGAKEETPETEETFVPRSVIT